MRISPNSISRFIPAGRSIPGKPPLLIVADDNHRQSASNSLNIRFAVVAAFLFLTLSSPAQADPVSSELASQAAQRFLENEQASPPLVVSSRTTPPVASSDALGLTLGTLRPLTSDDGDVIAWLQCLEPVGFIIVTADRTLPPILSFSYHSECSLDAPPHPLHDLIATDILTRRAIVASGDPKASALADANCVRWSSLLNSAPRASSDPSSSRTTRMQWGPSLATEWDQGTSLLCFYPFGGHWNNHCPYVLRDIGGSRRVVGCVATASAQIVNYWAYPVSIRFTDDDYIRLSGTQYTLNDLSGYGVPSITDMNANCSNLMYDGTHDEEAYLSLALGIKLHMNYGCVSTANTASAADVYLTDLGYGSAEPRQSTISGLWQDHRNIIISNLQNGMPVHAGIRSTGAHTGHSVVVDGYRDDDEWFHVNMGWGGSSNAWYNIPPIDTYDIVHTVMFNISPYHGWDQLGADQRNSYCARYPAPVDPPDRKWPVHIPPGLPTSYRFSHLVVGTGQRMYAGLSPLILGDVYHPYVAIYDKYGSLEDAIEIPQSNGAIRYLAQNSQGQVFFGTDQSGPPASYSQLLRLDPQTGEVVPIATHSAPDGGIFERPIKIDKDNWVYFIIQPRFASNYAKLYCVAYNGHSNWPYYAFPTSATLARTVPAIDEDRDRIYLNWHDGSTQLSYLGAVNRFTGTNVFSPIALPTSMHSASEMAGHPAISSTDGTVYIGAYTTLFAYEPTGSLRWQQPFFPAYTHRTPAIGVDGTLYVNYGKLIAGNWRPGFVRALDPADGSQRWEVSLPLGPSDHMGELYAAPNKMIVCSYDKAGENRLVGIQDNGTSGQIMWDIVGGGTIAFGPQRTVYSIPPGNDQTIYALADYGERGDPEGLGMDYADNAAPYVPAEPYPADGSLEIPLTVELSWAGLDPDGHDTTYDVFGAALLEGRDGAFVPFATNVTDDHVTIAGLRAGTRYAWAVVATDGQAVTHGPDWTFTTRCFESIPEWSDCLGGPGQRPSPFNELCEAGCKEWLDVDLDDDVDLKDYALVQIVAGAIEDCNSNGISDADDLSGGTSVDCNINGIPDECDVDVGTSRDCNDNAVPDGCEIASGTGVDANSNGVLDECDPIAQVWMERTPPLVQRYGHAQAFDSVRGVTVLFGGRNPAENAISGETWELADDRWELRSNTGPGTRRSHAMAFDSQRGVTVMFGGYAWFWVDSRMGDTWEWDGVTWQLRSNTGPSPRGGCGMVYDSIRGVTVLFGGYTENGESGETWEWDGSSWTLRSTVGPSPRFLFSMMFDSARGVTVLFGGQVSGGTSDETWEWDGINWIMRVSAVTPSPRSLHAMAFNVDRGEGVLFGGYDVEGNQGDTWSWDGSAWSIVSTNGPSPRYDFAMSADSNRGAIVAFGGDTEAGYNNGSHWEWTGAQWEQGLGNSPVFEWGHKVAYDSARERTVLFGGFDDQAGLYSSCTWEWNGRSWRYCTNQGPSARVYHAMVFDSLRGVTVLFGGDSDYSLDDSDETWEWDGTSWLRAFTGGPSARSDFAMAYDGRRGVTVLFGGYLTEERTRSDETWEWNGNMWAYVNVSGPSARFNHAMTYDSRRECVVMFGGKDDALNGETWEWDGSIWNNRTTVGPEPRSLHSLVFDEVRGVCVLTGGYTVSGHSDETWEWDGYAWTQHDIPGPSARTEHAVACDSGRNVAVLFGGSGGGTETWEYGADCNTNAMPDSNDIAWGTSADGNTDGVPDECDTLSGMLLIPAGEFLMGDTLNEGSPNELPAHTVYVDAFYMNDYEVTNQQYVDALNWALDQNNLVTVSSGVVYKYDSGTGYPYCSTTSAPAGWPHWGNESQITWDAGSFGTVPGKASYPMVLVSWYGAAAYANWRSGMEGRTPSYNTNTWECNFAANGYRLPTEAEWEKAARGGVSGHRFPWSDTDEIQHARANYYSSDYWAAGPYDTSPTRGYHPMFSTGAYPYTSPVGYFAANGYGLYDMAGNVWEWCNDWYSSTYYDTTPYPHINPVGPLSGSYRTVRGGAWDNYAYYCRVVTRDWYNPDVRDFILGFRLALDAE